jgi:hypothetical protein
MTAPSVTAEPRPAERAPVLPHRPAARRRPWILVLVALFAASTLYHWLNSRGHVTPAVFTDELMFQELARSVASGDRFTVRGQDFSFPAFVSVLVQAPAWLVDGAGASYALAKTLNAHVMSLAVFPAYWAARRVVSPAHAAAVAAASVAVGPMLYHAYLTSEAVAYPVFLLAVGVVVRALGEPSRRWDVLAVAAMALAVLTRAQFVALPIVFAAAVPLVALLRRESVGRALRLHVVALVTLAAMAMAALARSGSLLGFYGGARELEYPALETIRWAGWTAALLPYAAGLLVVPGALLGLGYAIARPRSRTEAAFGVVAAALAVVLPIEAGLIASGEAHRPIERYAFYVLPLVFAAFFAYVERGAPQRRVYAAVALAGGGLGVAVPFGSLAVDSFSFDSPTVSAVEALGRWTSPGDAAALFAAAGLVAAIAAAAIPLRRAHGALAAVSVVLALAIGLAAYSGDRRMTRRTLASLAPAQPDWLDRSGVGRADVLVLPGGSLHFGWVLESWNRNVGRTYHLGDVHHDPLPYTRAAIRSDGTVAAVGGGPLRSDYLVANDFGTQIELAGERVARPRAGLTLNRPEGVVRLRSLAAGLYADGWAQAVVRYRAWPADATRGWYQVRLELPEGRPARTVEVAVAGFRRRGRLAPGSSVGFRVPVSRRPLPQLEIRIERADLIDEHAPRPRLVGARITALEFVSDVRSRNR